PLEVHRVIQRPLIELWQHGEPMAARAVTEGELYAERIAAVNIHIVRGGDTDLLEVVRAGCPPRRLTRLLHGRQQQGDQDSNDGDDHQQLDQREPTPVPPARPSTHDNRLSLGNAPSLLSSRGLVREAHPISPSANGDGCPVSAPRAGP